MKFSSDSTLVLMQVSVASTADFEAAMAKVKEVLAKSDKPERKQQAAHWQVIKAEAAQQRQRVYAWCSIR